MIADDNEFWSYPVNPTFVLELHRCALKLFNCGVQMAWLILSDYHGSCMSLKQRILRAIHVGVQYVGIGFNRLIFSICHLCNEM